MFNTLLGILSYVEVKVLPLIMTNPAARLFQNSPATCDLSCDLLIVLTNASSTYTCYLLLHVSTPEFVR